MLNFQADRGTFSNAGLLGPWKKTLKVTNHHSENIKSTVFQLKCDFKGKISRFIVKISEGTKVFSCRHF